ncbi:S41 family peptidase [Mucisphaera sp.]|uniref:S41 family peptidase n=1 Tax=Mucisphaera sp. TaxID=2913024 RepID=UPI003D0B0FF9
MALLNSVEEVSPRRRLFGNLALVCCFAALILLTLMSTLARSTTGDQLSLLVDVRHWILSSYVEEIEGQELTEAAIAGMVESLDDPYTSYFPEEEYNSFSESIEGQFSGIGAEVDLKEDRLRIVSPLEGSPAWEAGVLAGDIVLEIDGTSTEGLSLRECIGLLKGLAGTDVTIKVRHLSGEEAEITITRDVIKVATVRGIDRDENLQERFWIDSDRKIAYIRLTQFGQRSNEEFVETLTDLEAQGIQGLILDLRFNLGGLLTAAQSISDLFLTGGQTIVSVRARAGQEQSFSSTDDTLLPDIPVVVLINDVSASASEIVAGALKDNGRAHLVGVRTFGKGSVQQVRELDGGRSALKLTTAYYYIPSGRKIHRIEDADTWGVDPSQGSWVSMTPDEVRAMINVRREAAILREEGSSMARDSYTPEQVEEELKDKQLAAGLASLLGYKETGAWPSVGIDNEGAVIAMLRRTNLERRRDLLRETLEQIEEQLEALDNPTEAASLDAEEAGLSEELTEPATP